MMLTQSDYVLTIKPVLHFFAQNFNLRNLTTQKNLLLEGPLPY